MVRQVKVCGDMTPVWTVGKN